MCGICGMIGNPGPIPEDLVFVRAMMNKLIHRGPDGDGLTTGPHHIFGHRRLSIIDLEGGAQPMCSPDGRYQLTFNGEIYNYLELRAALEAKGRVFRTHSDSEVLLEMLIVHGEKALLLLNGMFAFAFVDTQENTFLLARDPLGIKPLYYARHKERLYFASEIKALLLHPALSPRESWAGLEEYLTFQFCLNHRTLFEGIEKVPPGTFLKGRTNTAQLSSHLYWEPNYAVEPSHINPDAIAEELLALLEDSLKLQVRSDVPVGAYLAGGLDSSVVTCLAKNYLPQGIQAFHGRFQEGPAYDESPYARQVAQSCNAEYIEVVPTARQFVDFLPSLIYYLDEPLAGPGLFPQYLVSKRAAQSVKVVLGGQGGDELFGGYARYLIAYLEQALKGAILGNQEEGQYVVSFTSLLPQLPLLREYLPLVKAFWSDGIFGPMDARYFRLVDRSPDVLDLLSEDVKARFDKQRVFADFGQIFNHPDTLSYINKMTHFDLKTLLPALLHVEDRVSMAASLEARVPLLDRRIVDFVVSLPPILKFRDGQTKHILRKAVRNLVPKTILERKDKMGFPVPLKEWLQAGPVRDFVHDTLFSKSARAPALFDQKKTRALLESEGRYGRQIWGILCLELWYRAFRVAT